MANPILQGSIDSSNHVMDLQVGTQPHPSTFLTRSDSSSSVYSSGTSQRPSQPSLITEGNFKKTSAPTVTTNQIESDKSISEKKSKNATAADEFIENYAANQKDGKLLSCKDPWFQETLAAFRAKQAIRTAVEKDQAARAAAAAEMKGENVTWGKQKGNGKKTKRNGFRAWLMALW